MTEHAEDAWLDHLERVASACFRHEVDDVTGLVRDNSRAGTPASIAGSGFALTCHAIAAERGYLSRDDTVERTRRALRNSRRATYVQREYARRNTRGFTGYDAKCWGITASDGQGPALRLNDGATRRFWKYRARGVPHGPDDGTISP